MAFENLSERLKESFKNITGKGKLTEKNMDDMLREVRMNLLEADVNYGVVKKFIANIKEKAMGEKVLSSMNPSQMVLKIVRDELQELLGQERAEIAYKPKGITTIMMVGLQGTGKTTAAAKIANVMKLDEKRKVMLVACDIIRPAAIEQLQTLGNSINVEVFTLGVQTSALETAQKAMIYAQEKEYDTVIFDTAGRLHIDDDLMQELEDIKASVQPDEILLTVDAMTGQDIVNVASSFHDRLAVTGLVVTKLDGDARGGGVLSVRAVTNVPVKFVGEGEKIEDLNAFYPDRMAERILGMGDMLTLIENLEKKIDVKESEDSAKRMMSGNFTLNDMLFQYEQINKMGPLGGIMKMLPGMGQMANSIDDAKAEEKIKKSKAIIQSMTLEERNDPSILRASRKNRIAKGSGTTVADVNRCIQEYEKMRQMFKQISAMQKNGGMPGMPGMNKGGIKGMRNAARMSKLARKMNRGKR